MNRVVQKEHLLAVLCIAGIFALPCSVGAEPRVFEARLPQSGLAEYVQHLQALRGVAEACAVSESDCDPGRVPPDERVSAHDGSWFEAHYGWIRDAMNSGKSLPAEQRAALMRNVQEHLVADLADARFPPSASSFSAARKDANAILARSEFNTVPEVSLREQLLARFYEWIERMLGHVAGFGSRSPWIAPLLEWLLGSVACSLLLVWILRTLRRQRVQIRLESNRPIEQSEERVLNWIRASEEYAAAGSFRDAVHCLYWASIALLEGRRLWNPDRARTPREYLRLLDPRSPAAPLLRRQTLSFETIWYGLRAAERPDYESALSLYQELRSA